MNKVHLNLISIILISIILFSCAYKENNKNKIEQGKVMKPATNKKEFIFEPGKDWKLVWSDEFETDSIDKNNWNFQVLEAGHFNGEWQRYTNSPKNAYIENGCLTIKAIHENEVHAKGNYTSARLHTANKQTWKYGKIAARVKLPYSKGIWPAFWMLGANINENGGDTLWPQCGEIDIFELYGSKDNAVVEANIHYADASNSHANMGATSFKLKEGKFADAFHVFELEWDKNKISWFVDGEKYASTPITSDEMLEFHKEFFILLNLAVGGTWAGYPDSNSTFPQYMYVDWVRVYKKIG